MSTIKKLAIQFLFALFCAPLYASIGAYHYAKTQPDFEGAKGHAFFFSFIFITLLLFFPFLGFINRNLKIVTAVLPLTYFSLTCKMLLWKQLFVWIL